MSTAADLLEFLTAEVAEGHDTAEVLLAKARAKIVVGGGQIAVMTSGSANGKSFTFNVKMDAAEVARVCRQALAADEGDDVVSSSLDFSQLGTLD